ncbi:glycosyltransferase family 2 protein [Candidatus Woesearchaeota archaeon]|nr:glycosyltransferase family 2 protein [Candidatus Woesearchaeota archaeon]
MLSIVIPAYNEEKNIPILYREISSVLKSRNYEIIFIDDGSTDRTFQILAQLNKRDKKIRVIKFRRNFGQTAAWDAGFKEAKGEIIVVMDADLQNDPQDIIRLLKKLDEGCDMVSGWRARRKDSISKRLFSRIANNIRKAITKERIHDSGCSLKAYRRECLEDIELYGDMHRYLPALLLWKGFKIGEIKVNHRKRKFGKTKYGIGRIVRGFLDLLIIAFWMRYSVRPMHFFGGLGIVSFLTGFGIGLHLTIAKIVYNISLADRPLLLLAVLLTILGVQFFALGIVADISMKTYHQRNEDHTRIEKRI